MKTYFNDDKFYSYDGFVYKIDSFETYDNHNYMVVHFSLVAGWDYVNPDENDVQGWYPAENFIDDVQTESVVVYFMQESVNEALDSNGFEPMENFNPKFLDKDSDISCA